MRCSILMTLFLLLMTVCLGQSKKVKWTITAGIHRTSTYTKFFYRTICIEGCTITQQTGASFIDFNLLYARGRRNKTFRLLYGIGGNQKGYLEKGLQSPGDTSRYPYTRIIRNSYVSLYAGLSYVVFDRRHLKIILGQLLNPEIAVLTEMELPRTIPLGTRTILSLEQKIGNNFSFVATPYFQFSLSNYNRGKLFDGSSNYRPFGVGLNLGFSLDR